MSEHGTARRVIGLLASMALLMGCSTDAPDAQGASATPEAGLESHYSQKLSWRSCQNGFECTTVKVPLDYATPQGEQLNLAVTRLPAKSKSRRIGSLVTNPGGPGGSGISFIRQAVNIFGGDVRERFDLVGFDPRGVGESNPIRCMGGPQLDRFFSTDTSPDNQSETDALRAQSQDFANVCKTRAGGYLPYVGTENAARDMDVLRSALGDSKLTYVGFSYGTYLGAFYAEQFPRNVRALVLDGAVDPRLSATELLVEQANGFEAALRSFVADCATISGCPLGSDPNAALERISDLQRQADRSPLKSTAGDPRRINETWVTIGMAAALYNKGSWPTLRLALSRAINQNDGDLLLGLADQLLQRKPDGSYTNQMEANMAVNCVDKPNPPNADAYAKEVASAETTAPHFGPFVVWSSLPCVYWPTQVKATPKPVSAKGAAPILVIGTTRDPATPYRWAKSLSSQLESATLLTLEGDGHTAYLGGPQCITQATDRYLITGTPPKAGTICR